VEQPKRKKKQQQKNAITFFCLGSDRQQIVRVSRTSDPETVIST
jgi:hypothetical protein